MDYRLLMLILILTIIIAILTIIVVIKEFQKNENDEYINKILKSNERLKLELLEMSAYAKSLKKLNDIQEHLLKEENL